MFILSERRSDYQQLVYSALSFKNTKIKLLKPCIVRPCQLWSGKQVSAWSGWLLSDQCAHNSISLLWKESYSQTQAQIWRCWLQFINTFKVLIFVISDLDSSGWGPVYRKLYPLDPCRRFSCWKNVTGTTCDSTCQRESLPTCSMVEYQFETHPLNNNILTFNYLLKAPF